MLPRTICVWLVFNLFLIVAFGLLVAFVMSNMLGWFVIALLTLLQVAFAQFLRSDYARAGRQNNNVMSQFWRLSDSMRRSAIYDEATGLYHRWYFDLRLEEELRRSKRYDEPTTVMTIRTASV